MENPNMCHLMSLFRYTDLCFRALESPEPNLTSQKGFWWG